VYVLLILRQLELGVPGAEPVGVDEAPSSSRMPAAPNTKTTRPERDNARSSIADVEHVIPRASSEHRAATPAPSSAPPQSGPGGPSSAPAPVTPASPAAARSPLKVGAAAAAAPGATDATAALRAELDAIFERIGGSHYEVLGVPNDAPVSVIQNAFFALAKKWHPDRLRSDLADVKDQATRVFARISEASQTLSDSTKRREYDQQLGSSEGQDEAEQVHKVLKATSAFQKAEVLLKRGNLALAEKEALIAFENDPTQADHVALHVWIQSQKPGADVNGLAAELEKAVKVEPNNLRVRWYRGQLLKRMGRLREAVHDFRFIIERDPRHTDAHREVRLYAMRSGGRPPSDPPSRKSLTPPDSAHGRVRSTPPAKPGGLLNKLFKKS
jgi:curved DNA-binding protein CbpA